MNEKSLNTPMPTVTVITGYYNRAHALEKTIDSIMRQTYTDFEFIVFNDCSTDDTTRKLKEIEIKYNDPRLIIINYKNNRGFVQGMVDSVKLAKGKYICVQGSGDISHKNRLAEQVAVLRSKPNVGVVNCFYSNFVEEKNITRLREYDATGISLDNLISQNYFSHGEVMFRKSCYDKVGGYRAGFKFCQDKDLWFRMIKICDFFTVKTDLYQRFVRFDGVSYTAHKFILQARYSIFAVVLANKKNDADEYNNMLSCGIENTIRLDNNLLQIKVFKAALRAIIWDNMDLANDLCKLYATKKFNKIVIKVCVFLFKSPIGSLLKVVANRIFKVRVYN